METYQKYNVLMNRLTILMICLIALSVIFASDLDIIGQAQKIHISDQSLISEYKIYGQMSIEFQKISDCSRFLRLSGILTNDKKGISSVKYTHIYDISKSTWNDIELYHSYLDNLPHNFDENRLTLLRNNAIKSIRNYKRQLINHECDIDG